MTNEQLVEQIKNGYHVTECMQRLYKDNLPLLKKFIKPYTYFESEEDLLQEAYFGLWNAVQHYESSKNVLFMTYAQYWIRQSIQQYVDKCVSTIRIPSAYRQKIVRYKKIIQKFEQIHGRIPTDKEIAEYGQLTAGEIQKIQFYIQETVSLDAPLIDNEDISLSDTLADNFNLENDTIDKMFSEYQKTEMWSIVEQHTKEIQSKILWEHYKRSKTLSQIANEMGLTSDQVKQYKDDGLRRLRSDKAKQEILEKFEIMEASAYRSGLKRFREHGNSNVEFIAIRKIELEEKYIKRRNDRLMIG